MNEMEKEFKEFIDELHNKEIISFAGVAEIQTAEGIKSERMVWAKNCSRNTIVGFNSLWINILTELCKNGVITHRDVKKVNSIITKTVNYAVKKNLNDKELTALAYATGLIKKNE